MTPHSRFLRITLLVLLLAGLVAQFVQADAPPEMSNIVGAMVDQQQGELVVFGVADPTLPAMSPSYVRESLILALRAYRDRSVFELPGVTFEGTEDPIAVRYFGGVENTHFGQVVYQSDRLLKLYSMGQDNLTGEPITCTVPGYQSIPDRLAAQSLSSGRMVMTRYFFTPTLSVETCGQEPAIAFTTTQHLTDWAFMSSETCESSRIAAQGFTDHLNANYWAFAADRYAQGDPTLYEMAQLSKITAIAQWLDESGHADSVPGMYSEWLDLLPVTSESTPAETTGIVVNWQQSVNGSQYQFTLRGGVYAVGRLVYQQARQATLDLVDEVREALTHRAPPHVPLLVGRTVRPLSDSEGPLVAYALPLAEEALTNGCFDLGPDSGWSHNSPDPVIRGEQPYDGEYSAIFPLQDGQDVILRQDCALPSDADLAMLRYTRAVASEHTEQEPPCDTITVAIDSPEGQLLREIESLSNQDADLYWHHAAFEVSEMGGRALSLRFQVQTDDDYLTTLYLDNVRLMYRDIVPPSITQIELPVHTAPMACVSATLTFHEPLDNAATIDAGLRHIASERSFCFVPVEGSGFSAGYWDVSEVTWRGTLRLPGTAPTGEYALQVAGASDRAANIMPIDNDVARITISGNPTYHAHIPFALR